MGLDSLALTMRALVWISDLYTIQVFDFLIYNDPQIKSLNAKVALFL